ncbi:sugar ABC transporter ATP-binding protein [Kineothrix sedimenti]|uniref:Sugar ABC transporter ATP-binding protein n=1 Tax=Kineothrix sedimenti TaxID=3123317 RepID=A0ABZ3EXG0_9FIRM
MADAFLRLENIKKSFGGVHALKGIDLTINSGEIHCLAGENGCGKSTLIKVISGAHDATEGCIYIEGKKISHLNPIDSIRMGIQVIYQDFAVFPNLSVAENIAMNRALMTGAKRMQWNKARQLALEAMEQIGAHMDPDILVEQLSVANKQMVAICRAIINDAKLLILDEPTTALTAKEVAKLNVIIRRLKEKGMAVVIVNHKLNEIYEIADRLTVLRNGENVATGLIEEFDKIRFIKCLTGRDLDEITYRPEKSEKEILKVRNLTKEGSFEDVSFTLNKGDVLGITGLLGSGRGEIGDALFGIAPADKGSITLNGKKLEIKSVMDAVKHKIGYVPEDRLTQGLFLDRSIQDNTVSASIQKYLVKGKLDYAEMYKVTEEWIRKIGCAAPSPTPDIRTLSGGNAQKMVIAKWLNTNPDLLILNGPTVGVDVGSKSDIHKILHDLASKGVGIIIISDDLQELIQNCNKIVVMKNGKPSGELEASDLDEITLTKLLSGK